MTVKKVKHQGREIEIKSGKTNDQTVLAEIDGEQVSASIEPIDANTLSVVHKNHRYITHFAVADNKIFVFVNGQQYVFEKTDQGAAALQPGIEAAGAAGNVVGAPMPGKLLKIFVNEGQSIGKGDRLFIIEAMKMENEVKSSREGVVKKIHFKENDLVSVGEPVVELDMN